MGGGHRQRTGILAPSSDAMAGLFCDRQPGVTDRVSDYAISAAVNLVAIPIDFPR